MRKLLVFILLIPLTGNSQTIKDSLYKIGLQHFEKADEIFYESIDSSLHYMQLALPYFEKSEHWDECLDVYNGLFTTHYNLDNIDQAELYAKQAVDYAQKHLAEKDFNFIKSQNNLGVLYSQQGRYDQSLIQFKKVLELKRKYGVNKESIEISCANLASSYLRKGDYDEAIRYQTQGLNILLDTLDSIYPRTIQNRLSLSLIYKEKEIDKAIPLLEQCIEDLAHFPNEQFSLRANITVYQSLADIYIKKEETEKSLINIKKAMHFQKGKNPFRIYTSHELLGRYYMLIKKHKLAEEQFKMALELLTARYHKYINHPNMAKAHFQLANLYQAEGNHEKALRTYQKTLQVLTPDFKEEDWRKNPGSTNILSLPDGISILKAKANSLVELSINGDQNKHYLTTALQTYLSATALIKKMRQSHLSQKSKLFLAENSKDLYEKAISTALSLYKESDDRALFNIIFQFIEQNKSVVLLESIHESIARKTSDIPDSLLQLENQLIEEINFFETAINKEKGKGENGSQEKIKTWTSKIFEYKENHHNLISSLEQKFPKYNRLKKQTDFAQIKDIQQNILDSSTALIEYFIGNKNVFIFIITSNDIKIHRFEKEADFETKITRIRQLISQPPSQQNLETGFQEYTQIAFDLYQKLIQPVLLDELKSLIIVPDDILGLLPFEVLLTAAAKGSSSYSAGELSYLLEKFNISYSYSSTLLLSEFETSTSQTKNVFVGFAPSFAEPNLLATTRSCQTDKLYSLHCNEEEVNRIQKLLGGKKFLGNTATLSAFSTQVPQSNIIHLATHACADDNNHEFNKIYFADGHLSNNDLYHSLFQSQLAVLSACNTGSGQLAKGEGVMSLSRGFIHAGCKSIVTSFWSVDDCSTSDIMINFYRQLKDGLPKNQALKKAKLDFLISSKKARMHPYYWAAFVQFGDINEISFKNTYVIPKLILITMLGCIGLGVIYWFRRKHILKPFIRSKS